MIERQPEKAARLLSDDFFQDVVKKQRELYISNILNSPEDAVDVRERTLAKLRGLEEFIASIESISATSEMVKKRWKIF